MSLVDRILNGDSVIYTMKEWFWPDIDDSDKAAKMAYGGATVCFLVTAITAVIAYLQSTGKIDLFKGMGSEAYIDCGLFFVLGLGLVFKSRIAALGAFGLYVFEQVMMMKMGMSRGSLVMLYFMLYFPLVLAHSIRGTFAYHRFRKEERDEAKKETLA